MSQDVILSIRLINRVLPALIFNSHVTFNAMGDLKIRLGYSVLCVCLNLQVIGSDYYMPVLLSFLRRFVTMAEGQVRAYASGTASMAFVTVPDMTVAKNIAQ